MPTVKEIATAIEAAAPLCLQESYDNSGLQIGREGNSVDSVLVCLTPTEAIVNEAIERGCNLIVSHHPLLFRGLKRISDATATERIAVQAIRHNISLYAAHTNLDSTAEGVSADIAQALGMTDVEPLVPTAPGASTGLGTIGEMPAPVPVLEFLRQLQKVFGVKALRYSATTPKIVIRRVAVCGGSGSSFITDAIARGADAYVTGDLGYHDFDSYGSEILLADIGHFESELGARKLLRSILEEAFPDLAVMTADCETNPVKTLSYNYKNGRRQENRKERAYG